MNFRQLITYAAWVGIAALLVLVVFQNRAVIRSAIPSFSGASAEAPPQGARPLVTIDMAQVMNAQRALASRLSGDNPDGEAASTLSRSGRNMEAAIRQAAGPDAVVIVAQAVVSWPGQMPDITDEVIDTLGLPEDAPSVSYGGRDLPAQGNVDPDVRASRTRHEQAIKNHRKEIDDARSGTSILP